MESLYPRHDHPRVASHNKEGEGGGVGTSTDHIYKSLLIFQHIFLCFD